MRESLAIVVPGHSRAGVISARCRRLVDAAAELAEHLDPATVVFSGRWEAEQMAERWHGPRDVELVVEPTARTTAENACRSLQLLLERVVTEAVVVCAPLHAPRVRYFFRALYGRYGIACEVRPTRWPPHPYALAREVAAAAIARRQLAAAVAELERLRAA